jgi:antibiotic biosynthesis monooxygenase (ABM) superfamily enzyme
LEFPGCLRCHVVPPLEGVQAEWIFMAAFSDPAALRTWVESPQRARWLKEVEPLVDDTGPMRVISGLEALFGLLPPDQAKPPAVWKLAAVTLTGLYPTLLLSATFLAPRLQGLPLLPRVLLSALATVLVMTWGVMPLMTRMFRPWLYPRR